MLCVKSSVIYYLEYVPPEGYLYVRSYNYGCEYLDLVLVNHHYSFYVFRVFIINYISSFRIFLRARDVVPQALKKYQIKS